MKTPVKFYPVPERNPALDPFRGRQWSESAMWPAAPRRKPVRFVPSGKVFVISRFEVDQHDARQMHHRRFAVVAADITAAEQRLSFLYP